MASCFRTATWLALTTALAACSATAPIQVGTQGAASTPPPGQAHLIATSPVPAVSFQDLNGTTHKLDEFKGKPVLLVVFAYWCPHCQDDMPQLQAFADAHPNVAFVPVEGSGGAKADVETFKSRYGVKGAIYYDPSQQVAKTLAITGFPTCYLLGPDGTAWDRSIGLPSLSTYDQLVSK